MPAVRSRNRFVICTTTREEDLILHKIYRLLPDQKAAKVGYVRVVDESGEDYLYPKSYFTPIQIPQTVSKALMKPVAEVL